MSAAVRAWIVATGDELLQGRALDTNSAWIARELAALGVLTERILVLGDDEAALRDLAAEGARSVELVVVTGGLGPTLDDLTRHALAAAAGVELVEDARALETLHAWFAAQGRSCPESNRRQALFPRGAQVLPNALGSAPGFLLRCGRALIAALPGPPREMERMFSDELRSRLETALPPRPARALARFHLFGLSEAAFADRCGDWMARGTDPLLGVTAHSGVLSAQLSASTEALLAARAEEFRGRFREWIFSEESGDLARVLGELLLARGITIATAESCTGGLLAQRLTQLPGISAVFGWGFVSYADAAKQALLGVEPALLESHGAVSLPVAEAMARGAAQRSGARLALSITGVAGPEGGTQRKPVGMVCFATSLDGLVQSTERRFAVRGRDLIREFAAQTALDLARRRVLDR
jgi:nicotinamide-nucleotide amidase